LNRIIRQLLMTLFFCAVIFGLDAISRTDAICFGSTAPPEEAGGAGEEHGGHTAVFKWINFAILAGGLGFVLRKPLAQFFTQRTGSIQKSLDEGRKALEMAEAQLKTVEEKLKHFEEEMAAFRAAALKDMDEEHARLRQTAAQEAGKIMESVRVQMDVASKQARLELRLYAAEQSVNLAEKMIVGRIDDSHQKLLASQFVARLEAGPRGN
jgi:F-type H+-transporting ATPase subunit b